MTVVWPSELPQSVTVTNHRQQIGDGRLRSSTDSGPGKVGRRFSSTIRPVSGDLIVTTSQKIRIERFWDVDTDGGTQPFLFPAIGTNGCALLDDEGVPLLDFDDVNLADCDWWLVRFSDQADPPPFDPRGNGEWTCSLALQVLP